MLILEIIFRYGEGYIFGIENKIKFEYNESGYFEKVKNKIMLFF